MRLLPTILLTALCWGSRPAACFDGGSPPPAADPPMTVVATPGEALRGPQAGAAAGFATAQAAARAQAYRRVAEALIADIVDHTGRLSAEQELIVRQAIYAGIDYSDERIDDHGYARVTGKLSVETLNSGAHRVAVPEMLRRRTYADVGVVAVLDVMATMSAPRPTGWEDTRPDGLADAALAARSHLAATLAERIAARRGNAAPDAAPDAAHDAVPKLRALLAACQWEDPVYEPCQVCITRACIPANVVERELGAAPAGVSPSATPDYADWQLVGLGAAPWSATGRMDWAPGSIARPEWAYQVMTAVGSGVLAAGEPDRDTAVRAARIDALMRLTRQIDALAVPYPHGATARDVIEGHPSDDDVWAAYLQTAWDLETRWSDDVCTVTAALDLRGLWALLAPRLETTVVRRPAEAG